MVSATVFAFFTGDSVLHLLNVYERVGMVKVIPVLIKAGITETAITWIMSKLNIH